MPDTAESRYSKEFWDELFDRYYHDEILKLAGNFPVECALKVEFGNLKRVWGPLGETMGSAIEYLVNNPEKVIDDGNDTLRNFDKLPGKGKSLLHSLPFSFPLLICNCGTDISTCGIDVSTWLQ